VETLAYPLALFIIVAAPVAVIGAAAGVSQWSRWLVRTGGLVGLAGLVVTGAATINLAVARTCATDQAGKTVEPPIISAATGEGDCFRTAWGQLEGAALAGVGASALVLLRRARRDGAGAAPGAPSR